MFPRLLDSRFSLDTLDEHTTYTLVRLETDPSASDLAPSFTALETRTISLRVTERDLGRAEVRAQAKADQVSAEATELVTSFGLDLLRIVGGIRGDVRWARLFSESPSTFARKGLESQMEFIRTWPSFLASEPSLAAWVDAFTKIVNDGTVALTQRDLAATTRSNWRALDREALYRDANQLRESLYGQLCQRAVSAGKSRKWPASFFKTDHSRKRQEVALPVVPQ